jgi:hypothetical protein
MDKMEFARFKMTFPPGTAHSGLVLPTQGPHNFSVVYLVTSLVGTS